MNAKSAILMAAVAASANAYTISADQSKQLDIIFKDVMDNLMDYMNLVSDPSSGITADNLPAGLMDLGAAMAVDPSYVPDYSSVDIDAVSTFITKLTWFDSKLEPELEAAGVPMVVAATTAAPTTAAPAQTSAAASTPAATTPAATDAATTPAATDAATTPAATDAATTPAATDAATTPAGETTAAAAQTSAAAPAVSVSAAASAPAPATNGTAGVETKFLTSTKLYHNTTVITSCPPESSTVVDITAKKTSTVTETVCDEACHSRKAAASAASTVTKKDTSTVTATVCDEACHSKKAAASSAAKKTSTVAQVTNAKTSSKPVIEQQTENGAIKAAAGMGAGVLAAAALLI